MAADTTTDQDVIDAKPLLRITTATGGSFHVLRTVLAAARASGARDVPLCNWRGDAVQPGERATLRLSTIEASEQTPLAIVDLSAYLSTENGPEESEGLSASL